MPRDTAASKRNREQDMDLYYNPLDRACKSIVGAIPRKKVVTLNVYKERYPGGEDYFSAEVCNLVLRRDEKNYQYYQMTRTDFGWTISLKFHETGLFFYYFAVGGHFLGCGAFHKSTMFNCNPVNWQLTVHDEKYKTPEWFKGGVMYQIFPDRFYRAGEEPLKHGILRKWGEQPYFRPNGEGKVLNNDFFGGNLKGVCEKLPYLKSLGVTVIYFNPIFESYSNHRYDTGDYMEIDPNLGSKEDFDALIRDAEKQGMRVILDGVFNHTGDDSRYFNRYSNYPSLGAYQSTQSPYYDWYTFHGSRDRYDSWWGIETLPAIKESSESYQNFMFSENGVIKSWLKHGIGGYRLDVADELPGFFLKMLRKAAKDQDPDAVIIGEVWEDASNKIAYGERREYFQGEELDSVMNYPLKDAIINFLLSGNTNRLREVIAMLIDHYPKATLDSLMNHLGTHDTARILTVLGGKSCQSKEEMAVTHLSDSEKEAAKELLKMGAVVQFTLPGVPCIYYGDEIGMEGYSDPFCRGCFDWENGDRKLKSFYEQLGRVRHELIDIFRDGIYREVYATRTFLLYERRSDAGSAYIYVNRGTSQFRLKFRGEFLEHLSGTKYEDGLLVKRGEYGILTRI